MNKIEKQILLNQKDIMAWLSNGNQYTGFFGKRLLETEELLYSKVKERPCEMPKEFAEVSKTDLIKEIKKVKNSEGIKEFVKKGKEKFVESKDSEEGK